MSEQDLWDLKEKAKWSLDPAENKNDISQLTLSTRSNEAISVLEEVLAVTAYNDIKTSCHEAIESLANGKAVAAPADSTDQSIPAGSTANDSNIGNSKRKARTNNDNRGAESTTKRSYIALFTNIPSLFYL